MFENWFSLFACEYYKILPLDIILYNLKYNIIFTATQLLAYYYTYIHDGKYEFVTTMLWIGLLN